MGFPTPAAVERGPDGTRHTPPCNRYGTGSGSFSGIATRDLWPVSERPAGPPRGSWDPRRWPAPETPDRSASGNRTRRCHADGSPRGSMWRGGSRGRGLTDPGCARRPLPGLGNGIDAMGTATLAVGREGIPVRNRSPTGRPASRWRQPDPGAAGRGLPARRHIRAESAFGMAQKRPAPCRAPSAPRPDHTRPERILVANLP